MSVPNHFPILAEETSDFWRESTHGGWATAIVLLFLLAWKLFATYSRRRQHRPGGFSLNLSQNTSLNPSQMTARSEEIISDADLRDLIADLDAENQKGERWEDVIDKRNGLISYNAKCCRDKNGLLKYLSITIFEKCSSELLRDFYMDNEYRKEWDKTLLDYKQLHVDEGAGTEIACMIKKFPFLTPREYVLAWRVWEGKDKSFYCVVKDCEHSLAPRQRKYVRVGFFRSVWRIRKVPGRDACEIKMVHQEDAGLNAEFAKLAFAKGIWSYVCKMNNAMRGYSSHSCALSSSVSTMRKLMKKVPPVLDVDARTSNQALPGLPMDGMISSGQGTASTTEETRPWEKPSNKQLIANGLLLLGGIACLARGRTTLGTQLAMACILKKFMMQRTTLASRKVPA